MANSANTKTPAQDKAPAQDMPRASNAPSANRRKVTKKQTRNAARSRLAILEAATQEFALAGFGGARTDEIARRADVNKALIYHYYGSKEALYVVVLEECFSRVRQAEADLELESMSPADAIRRLVDFTWEYQVNHPEFISLLNSENMYRGSNLKKTKLVHDDIVERIEAVLLRGAEDGVFRGDLDAIQLYITITSLGYFYLSNAYTLSLAFERDLLDPRNREARRSHIHEVVQLYIRPIN